MHRCGLWVLVVLVGGVLLSGPASAAEGKTGFLPVLSGTVYLPDGKPAAEVTLHSMVQETIEHPTSPPRATRMFHAGKDLFVIRTDKEGRFEASLSPNEPVTGTQVRFEGYLLGSSEVGWAMVSISFTLDTPRRTSDVHLTAGDTVQGTVLGYPDEKPLPDVKVGIMLPAGRHEQAVEELVTDTAGHFATSLALPPGKYSFWPTAKDYAYLREKADASAAPGPRKVILRLLHSVTLQGRVLLPDGTPLANQTIEVWMGGDGTEPFYPWATTGGPAHTDAQGRFTCVSSTHPRPYGEPALGFRRLLVKVAFGSQAAQVVVDVLHPTNEEIVFSLK